MKIKINQNKEPHQWFAWYPVKAEHKTPDGIEYYIVLFEAVRRVRIRVGGIAKTVHYVID